MDSKKLKMNTIGRESGKSVKENNTVKEHSYPRSKISNVLVFYVNGKEVSIIIYDFSFNTSYILHFCNDNLMHVEVGKHALLWTYITIRKRIWIIMHFPTKKTCNSTGFHKWYSISTNFYVNSFFNTYCWIVSAKLTITMPYSYILYGNRTRFRFRRHIHNIHNACQSNFVN